MILIEIKAENEEITYIREMQGESTNNDMALVLVELERNKRWLLDEIDKHSKDTEVFVN